MPPTRNILQAESSMKGGRSPARRRAPSAWAGSKASWRTEAQTDIEVPKEVMDKLRKVPNAPSVQEVFI